MLKPNITIDTVADHDIVNSKTASTDLTITGESQSINSGTAIVLSLNSVVYTDYINNDKWSVKIPAADLLAIPTGKIYIYGTSDGVTDEHYIYVKHSLPSIGIDPITGDDILNIAESRYDLTITGTTVDVENGQIITITFQKIDTKVVVSSNIWTSIIPLSQLNGLTDNTSYIIYATVTDIAGDVAYTQRGLKINKTIPIIKIDDFAVDNKLTVLEKQQDQIVSGTTMYVEDGQAVVVTFNGETYTTTVASNAWSLAILSEDLINLPGSKAFLLRADVINLAGNPARPAIRVIVTTPIPSIAITGITNVTPATIPLLSGETINVENGQKVTITFHGKIYYAYVYKGKWSVNIPHADIDGLSIKHTYVVTADVSNFIDDPAEEATYNYYVEPPSIPSTVDGLKTVIITNKVKTISKTDVATNNGLVVSGITTNVANYKIVAIVLSQNTGLSHPYLYTKYGVVFNSAWTVTIPSAGIQNLANSTTALDTIVSSSISETYGVLEDHFMMTVTA